MKGLAEAGSFDADGKGGFEGNIGEDWCQGRTVFGGLLATAAVRAMQQQDLPPGRGLRSAQVVFAAPVSRGRINIEVRLLRSGSSLTSFEALVRQAGEICTRVTACFGARRETCISIPGSPRPEAEPPDGIEPMPYIEGIVPTFIQHFDLRWTSPIPFTGASEARIQGWIRPKDDAKLDAAGLLSLVDAWPPPEIVAQERPFPLSSVTWHVNMLGEFPAAGVPPDGWWFYDSRTVWADGGYSDSTASLWDPGGKPVANSRQLVAEFSGTCVD